MRLQDFINTIDFDDNNELDMDIIQETNETDKEKY